MVTTMNGTSTLTRAIAQHANMRNVQTALAVYNQLNAFRNQFREWKADRHPWYSISIPEVDALYGPLYQWLESLPEAEKSSITSWKAVSDWRGDLTISIGGGSSGQALLDGDVLHFHSTSGDAPGEKDEDSSAGKVNRVRLEINARKPESIEKVKEKLRSLATAGEDRERPVRLFVWGKWGWQSSDAPLRPLESVVLADEHKAELTGDIRRFLDAEEDYTKHGLHWHRGYLLHGPPGTGKTSLIKALAREFKKNTYFLSLNDVNGDNELYERIREVSANSIVMLEDIDSCLSATDREMDNNISTGALLNILDGIFTPHGMLCFLTSNHPEKLDPALTRPGRVDYKLKLDYCTEDQVNEIFESFYGRPPTDRIILHDKEDIAPALIIEILKRNMYDAVAGEREIHNRAEFIAAMDDEPTREVVRLTGSGSGRSRTRPARKASEVIEEPEVQPPGAASQLERWEEELLKGSKEKF